MILLLEMLIQVIIPFVTENEQGFLDCHFIKNVNHIKVMMKQMSH